MIHQFRWANGNRDALSASAAYPRGFGRVFLFAYKCVVQQLSQPEIEIECRRFAEQFVQTLPPVGQQAEEARNMGLIGGEISVGGCAFHWGHWKTGVEYDGFM